MRLFKKKKDVSGDESTQALMKQGVYHIPGHLYDHPFHMDSKTIKKEKVYGLWPGVKYTVIVSLFLFWMPPFGQAISGYVGGRRAGGPIKGIIATLIPIIFVFIIFGLLISGALDSIMDVWNSTSGSMLNAASNIPVIGPIAEFSLSYLGFLSGYIGMDYAWMVSYVLVVIFGYVGGMLSLQHKRELNEYESVKPGGEGGGGINIIIPQTSPAQNEEDLESRQIGMDGDIPVIMGKKPDGWDEK